MIPLITRRECFGTIGQDNNCKYSYQILHYIQQSKNNVCEKCIISGQGFYLATERARLLYVTVKVLISIWADLMNGVIHKANKIK